MAVTDVACLTRRKDRRRLLGVSAGSQPNPAKGFVKMTRKWIKRGSRTLFHRKDRVDDEMVKTILLRKAHFIRDNSCLLPLTCRMHYKAYPKVRFVRRA